MSDRGETLVRGVLAVQRLLSAAEGMQRRPGWVGCKACKGDGVVMVMPSGFDFTVRQLTGASARFPKVVDGVRVRMLQKARKDFPRDRVHLGPCPCVKDSVWSGEFIKADVLRG